MSYSQPPHLRDEEIREFIRSAKIARICTHNKDGTIHAVPVWFNYDNERIFIGTPKASRRFRNIKRNNKVTVLIDEVGPPTRAIIIYGEASIDEEYKDEVVHSIFNRYMSEEKAKGYWRGLSEIMDGVIVIIKPTHMASFDYSKDKKYLEATKKYIS